jgi:ketosteroid isomerase-like protein
VRAPEDQVEIMQLVAQYGPAVDAKGTVMPDLAQQLWDIEQIKQLKARYFRLMDTKDWDAWKDLFTPDCVHYLPKDSNEQDETSRPHLTNDEYLTQIPAMLDKAFTVHHGHMPEITILGPTEAEGITAMFDYVMWPDGKTAIKGYGHYHETYRKCEDGKWRISSKDNRRLRVDPIPNTL